MMARNLCALGAYEWEFEEQFVLCEGKGECYFYSTELSRQKDCPRYVPLEKQEAV